MELQRKIYDKIQRWKEESQGSRALLIEGARRVGKSTIAERFAQEQYRSYVLVDFNKAPKSMRDNFENIDQLDIFFQNLSLHYNTRLYPRESLVIFDEIQRFPKAREAIKYLVADGRFDFLETGSLISIRENVEGITVPSEERKIKMHPLDFEEFAHALGEEMLIEHIRGCWEERTPLARPLHERAMRLFKEYLLVGGMPRSVVAYVEGNRDFYAADVEKRDILELYRDDIKKAARRYSSRVSGLFDQIPGYLSAHDKKVVLSAINSDGRFSEYDDPLFWLGDSMICNLCYRTTDPNVGFALTADASSVKCYLGDTGLLVSHAFSENEITESQLYREIMEGRLALNKGMLYENMIAQMLTAIGKKLYYYSRYSKEKHRNDVEIDFLLSNGSKTGFKVFPVEVKSSKNYSAVSLGKFRELYPNRIAESFIVHPKPLLREEGLTRIPPYMVFCAFDQPQ
ncbi:ATP-binding protein [Adlercreutzia sp. ZJ138]|uniref:ATP-binding protein n=1 Tax=Adlercreutzia sp. ZJ138 TaxID=2709405 RepID=UPI0013ED0E21|nr:AAA family ATPase [Adlercreutzia sp. ZJ138]